jgi:hypothetical protein
MQVSVLFTFWLIYHIHKDRVPGNYWIGVWAGPPAGLDALEKRTILLLSGMESQCLGRPARGSVTRLTA